MSSTTNLDKLKINYLTQAQYDSASENNQINENELYFTPGQDQDSSIVASTMVTLTTAGWSNSSQTVSVTGITASSDIIVSPANASRDDYIDAGIWCSAQGNGSLTFTCESDPSVDITVNVLIIL